MMQNILEQAQNILLVSHVQPDGDAIGALMALGPSLEARGKKVVMYNEDGLPPAFAFLPGAERITRDPGPLQVFDTLVVLDSGDAGRMGVLQPELEKIPRILNIDHHPSNTAFGVSNLIDPDAAATTVLIYRLLKGLNWPIPREAAWGIYTGIFTDTGGFRFGNTNTEALSIAAEMTILGVHPETVARHVYGKYSFAYIRLLQKALNSIRLSASGRLASMVLTRAMIEESGADDTEASGLVNYARQIEGVEMAALIREKENAPGSPPSYKVSLRSNGRMDATRIALRFGGGGHRAAAGFPIAMEPEEILRVLEEDMAAQESQSDHS
ncbi:DHH family phosphoesterase [Desulfobotulus sp.]|jgi:phosphoesterase RecJ-like protein|uniref:DHH family phosphoesterase n=1 Tax=Desulfobotulus sp. TaxID=1940337 RepID=UPI002A36E1AD|nr:DHH family phosphoesterase [Desulfobotulus sp.]MDY0163704.1 DHH family phosphoesterase [Desulfobotulus sp.]